MAAEPPSSQQTAPGTAHSSSSQAPAPPSPRPTTSSSHPHYWPPELVPRILNRRARRLLQCQLPARSAMARSVPHNHRELHPVESCPPALEVAHSIGLPVTNGRLCYRWRPTARQRSHKAPAAPRQRTHHHCPGLLATSRSPQAEAGGGLHCGLILRTERTSATTEPRQQTLPPGESPGRSGVMDCGRSAPPRLPGRSLPVRIGTRWMACPAVPLHSLQHSPGLDRAYSRFPRRRSEIWVGGSS